jgi:hypothetical protein
MPVMKEKVRFLGLDVHAETITIAAAEPDGEVRSLGTIANRAEPIRKLIKKLGPVKHLRACYEAGPTGYVLYWQLTELGVECEVIAPTLVPVKAGDRVKTDRRDALKLARSHRSADLTPVWVPDPGSEALRDLVRHSKLGLCVCALLDRHWHWPTTQVKRSDVENVKPPHELETQFHSVIVWRSPVRSFS